jgi:hypothetical protein
MKTRNWLRYIWAPLCVAVVPGVCRAQLPQPILDRVFPLGAKAGSQLTLEITGRDLDEVKSLHFDNPGFKAEFTAPNKFRVTIAAATPPGTHDVRAVGKFGISNAQLFVVSRGLTEVRKADPPPESCDKAQVVPLNAAVSGVTPANGADCYRFSAKKGQRLTIDCLGFRLNSQLRGVFALLSAAGKELARGTPYFNRSDPLLDFLVPDDGEYIVAVRDLTYAGDLPYRLVISDLPYIEQAFPPAVAPGKPTEVTLLGRNLPDGKRSVAYGVNGLPLDTLSISVALSSNRPGPIDFINLPSSPSLNVRGCEMLPPTLPDALNPITMACASDPVIWEREPNDTLETAQQVRLPAMIVGRFDRPGDCDWYSFTAKMGETVAVDLMCERLNVPGDPLVILTDEKGMELTAFDDHGNNINALTQLNRDPLGTFTIPADGTYRLQVQERNRKGGARFVYALRVGAARPDFFPVVYHETSNDPTCPVVRQGGASSCEFCVNRRDGFDGLVIVQAEGLPRGVTSPPIHVSTQTETANVVFLAASDAPEWAGPIRIRAWAMIDGKRTVREVGCVERRFTNGSNNTGTRVCREICLAVRSKAPYSLKTSMSAPQVSAGETLETKVALERLWPDFKDKVQITGLNLPPGFELASAEIAEGKTEVKVKVTVAAEVPPGTYTLNLRGEAQVPFKRDPAMADTPNVRVADPASPLRITVLPAPKK